MADVAAELNYKLFVSDDRCTLVRVWPSGVVEVAHRAYPSETWGPPVQCSEERVY